MARMSDADIERQNQVRDDVSRVGDLMAKAIICTRIDLALMEFGSLPADTVAHLFSVARLDLPALFPQHVTDEEARAAGRRLREIVAGLLSARDEVAQIMSARQAALAAPACLGTAAEATGDEDPQPQQEE